MNYSYAYVSSLTFNGFNCEEISIEAIIKRGIPNFKITGLTGGNPTDSAERIRAIIQSAFSHFPYASVMVNLSPVGLRKKGAYFDLPIAVALIKAMKQTTENGILTQLAPDKTIFLGEMTLSGDILPLERIFPFILRMREARYKTLVLPRDSLKYAQIVRDIDYIGISHISELNRPVEYFKRKVKNSYFFSSPARKNKLLKLNLDTVHLSPHVLKAMMLCASGFHSMLMIGPPGTGKTMLAKKIHLLLPEPDEKETLEIFTIKNMYEKSETINVASILPPFRAPHHTSTAKGLIGGGHPPTAGEITRAHNGILFLDELGEFSRIVLQSIREPLEEKRILISRGSESVELPSRFLLIAATNPCPCGYSGNPKEKCNCSPILKKNYLNRISGPLRDRFDLEVIVEKQTEKIEESFSMSEIVNSLNNARTMQDIRYKKSYFRFNSEVPEEELDQFIPFKARTIFDEWQRITALLSYRRQSGIRRLARTIADLSGVAEIRMKDIHEATSYRCLDLYRISE